MMKNFLSTDYDKRKFRFCFFLRVCQWLFTELFLRFRLINFFLADCSGVLLIVALSSYSIYKGVGAKLRNINLVLKTFYCNSRNNLGITLTDFNFSRNLFWLVYCDGSRLITAVYVFKVRSFYL